MYFISRYSLRCSIRYLSTAAASTSTSTSKPYYITTPIFYPNASPHIGHLYSLVTADIFARHARLCDRRVSFVTGTDEHGLKIQQTAKLNGVHPEKWCRDMSKVFYDLAVQGNISFTTFVRTSLTNHKDSVTYLWRVLKSKGYIYESTHSGWYSVSDECFYTDAQVLSSIDRDTGEEVKIAEETGNRVEWTEEVNYKFALSKFKEKLLEHYESNPEAIHPPHQYQQILTQLRSADALPDLSISRPSSRISWGVRVPDDDSQTIYVWLDALTAYLSGIGYPWTSPLTSEGNELWPPDMHVIGKDILRFHALYFPSFLLALDLELPKVLLSHSHWTVNQVKMSKSLGNVVDPFGAMKTYGVDVVRWYLARVGGRFSGDVDWSTSQVEKHELEIRSLLGNFYLRMQNEAINARLPESNLDVPLDRNILLDASDDGKEGTAVRENLLGLKSRVQGSLERHDVGQALDEIVDCLNIANKDYSTCEPWSPHTPASTILRLQTFSREALRISSLLLQPFIPSKSSQLLDALGVPPAERSWSYAELGSGSEQCGPMKRVMLFPTPKGRNRIKMEEEFNADLKDSRTKAGFRKDKSVHPRTLKQVSQHHSNFLYRPVEDQLTPPLILKSRPGAIKPDDG